LFSQDDIHLLEAFEEVNCIRPRCSSFTMPPTTVAVLYHWRVLAALISQLSLDQQRQISVLAVPTTFGGSPIQRLSTPLVMREPIIAFADSHFHLDSICSREGFRNFQDMENALHSPNLFLELGIANCVYPSNWKRMENLMNTEILPDVQNRVHFTFGVHPHFVLGNYSWEYLQRLLRHPRCVAVGEVGVDYTTTCSTCRPFCSTPQACSEQIVQAQVDFLGQLLPVVKQINKPLVLHCRDFGNGLAADRVLQLLQRHQMTNWPIHRHCFSGTRQELDVWAATLPQCRFGFTTTIQRVLNDSSLREGIARLPRDRLLLETDSPLLPPDRSQPLNTPWRIGTQAELLASLRGKPMAFILALTLANTRVLYNL
jgi:TatD DNase family protein